MNTKTKQIIFAVLAIMGLLKYGLLFITGSIFNIISITSWFSWLTLIIFLVFMWFFYCFAFKSLYSLRFVITMLAVMVIVVGVIGFFAKTITFGMDKNSSTGVTGTLTDANFDKKILNISSTDGSVTGTIGLIKKKNSLNKDYLSATYNILIKTEVSLNSKCGTPGYIMGSNCTKGYQYAGRLIPLDESGKKDSNGGISAVYCSDYKLPDPYSMSGTGNTMMACIKGSTDNIKVSTFATNFQTNYYSYAEVLKTNKFEMYDSSDYWEKDNQPGSFTNNTDKAVQQTNPVKTLQFIVSE